jgi:hypothetical protein
MDIERTIEFLLEQQARFADQQAPFASDMQVIKEVIKAQEEQLGTLGTALRDLASAQVRTNEIVETLAERHVELAEQHKITEQNLNSLIATVERHIAGHN